MFTEEELNELFNRSIVDYKKNLNYIEFIIDLKMAAIENNSNIYFNHSQFQLGDNGLLELLILCDGGILEYDKKIKNLDDLKYAITHLDEWVDDWNQDE